MLPVKRNKNDYLNKVSGQLFEKIESEADEIDLIIILDNTNISFRDFSAFLLLIDHFYGRTHKKGFLSYSLSDNIHLKANKINEGSIQIIVEDILKKLSVENAIYFFLLIKYLPAALKSVSESFLNLSESFLNLSESFLNYEKARLTRIARKNLRNELRQDELLKSLDDNEIIKLASKLQKKYDLDRKYIYKAAIFSQEKLKQVKLKRRNK